MVGPRHKGRKIFHQDQILSVMAAIGRHIFRSDGLHRNTIPPSPLTQGLGNGTSCRHHYKCSLLAFLETLDDEFWNSKYYWMILGDNLEEK